MLISPASYRRQLKPFHKEMFDYIHSKSQAKIFFHSCGSIRALIPDLIDAGVDILNPVQVSAADMDSAELKREFGRDICFWGGGVDTQNAFDERYTPDQVRADVAEFATATAMLAMLTKIPQGGATAEFRNVNYLIAALFTLLGIDAVAQVQMRRV